LIQSISQLCEEYFLAVLFQELEISVLAGHQDSSEDLEEVLKNLILVDFHAGEDLLTHKPCLNVDRRRSTDKPWQIYGNRVSFVGGRIFYQVVWEKVVIIGQDLSLRRL
jgi:5'-3' exonuclease